uniref:Predicted protein n=1 Tax=Hordeum vulgare subsp. vulgare TaxID=112509 RepID=F2DLK8_HORVV|nr:predicted protein [Hordeum vulgare subsp. vulgare]
MRANPTARLPSLGSTGARLQELKPKARTSARECCCIGAVEAGSGSGSDSATSGSGAVRQRPSSAKPVAAFFMNSFQYSSAFSGLLLTAFFTNLLQRRIQSRLRSSASSRWESAARAARR